MKIKLKKNLCSGVFAVLLGGGVLLSLPYTIKMKVAAITSAVGPDYLPKLVLGIMILCGIGLIFTSLVLKKDEVVEIDISLEKKVLLYMGIFILYGIALHFIGFVISSLLFASLSLYLMESKKPQYYITAAVVVVVIFAAFKYGLKVPLPSLFL